MNVFRAIENRVTVVRAATTGVSAFISSKGEILGRVTDGAGRDLFVSGILVRDVPLATARTFYTARGDIFGQAVTSWPPSSRCFVSCRIDGVPGDPVPGSLTQPCIPARR